MQGRLAFTTPGGIPGEVLVVKLYDNEPTVVADTSMVLWVPCPTCRRSRRWAEKSFESEERLAAAIRSGQALGDLLGIEEFLDERDRDPAADFNAHLARLGRVVSIL